jgi:SAM-dependent methyltransferase
MTFMILTDEATGGLGEMQISCPPGAFFLTPASLMALQTVGRQRHLLAGIGLDWGCGTGCLGLAAARITAVTHIIGLDISPINIAAARHNAQANNLAHKTRFFHADSYTPYAPTDQRELATLAGRVNFILANPPASQGDDGFAYRRVVLRGAGDFLAAAGLVFLSVSCQYGRPRIEGLCQEAAGFRYEGVLASSEWVPFDLARPDLRECLADYVAEERRGGLPYAFGADNGAETQTAQEALTHFQTTGQSPLTRWQVHLFKNASR